MARSLNRVQLIGNVGQDPEMRTAANTRVANFSLATSREWKNQQGEKQEATAWHRCVVWNNAKGSGLADVVEKYVRKGEKIYVEGEIEYRQWQDKDGQTRYTTEIRVRELMLLGGNGKQDGEAKQERPAKTTRPNTAERADDFPAALLDDDDYSLPF